MAGSVSGVGSRSSTSSSSAVVPSAGSRQDSSPASGGGAPRERGVGPRDPQERHYIHWEGRQFDMDAPRGTYVNILV